MYPTLTNFNSQMNYDGLLAQFSEDKLQLLQHHGSTAAAGVSVQDGAVEEEQAAVIQTVQLPPLPPQPRRLSGTSGSKSEASTPQRKISTSSRFMNAFQQFYTGASAPSSSSNISSTPTTSTGNNATTSSTLSAPPTNTEDTESSPSNSAGRTPTKGMESKLISMWHNVKYGWSGKIRYANFSKEQPVWLLGRCYHRKYTPPSSMESSVELDNNKQPLSYAAAATATTTASDMLTSASPLYPPLDAEFVAEIVVPQELGLDAVENHQLSAADSAWEEGIEGFRRDFYSRLWMTYRREFPTMNGSNYTSDCGWGCMLRSGQMLLAQALVCHFLGRSWRYDAETQLHATYEDNTHKKIIKWFGDSSSKNSPFSIHALVRLGVEMGKKPGDWYGPASVSYLLQQALKNAAQENADFDNIVIYVAKDCTIYMQDVQDACCIREQKPKQHVPWQSTRKQQKQPTNKEEEQHEADTASANKQQHWKSLIVLIPLRLGTEKLNPVYAHCLKLLLSTEYCIGIIGGRPKHSLYFVGYQEDKLIHLDPHYCQEMVDVNQEHFPVQSFHCKSPRKLKTSKMDPSCCIGFYCQTKTDFDNFVESVQLYLHPMRCASGSMDKMLPPNLESTTAVGAGAQFAEMNYPLFTFSRGRCMDHARDECNESYYKPLQRQLAEMRQELGCQDAYDDDDGETEEFVIL